MSSISVALALFPVADPDLRSDKGGPAHPDPEIRGEPGLKSSFFYPSGLSLVLKIRGVPGPLAPPLDPLLISCLNFIVSHA